MEVLALRDLPFNKLDFVILSRFQAKVYLLLRFQREIIKVII